MTELALMMHSSPEIQKMPDDDSSRVEQSLSTFANAFTDK